MGCWPTGGGGEKWAISAENSGRDTARLGRGGMAIVDETGADCAAAIPALSSPVTDHTRRAAGDSPPVGVPSPSESVMVFPSLTRDASDLAYNSAMRLSRARELCDQRDGCCVSSGHHAQNFFD